MKTYSTFLTELGDNGFGGVDFGYKVSGARKRGPSRPSPKGKFMKKDANAILKAAGGIGPGHRGDMLMPLKDNLWTEIHRETKDRKGVWVITDRMYKNTGGEKVTSVYTDGMESMGSMSMVAHVEETKENLEALAKMKTMDLSQWKKFVSSHK